MACWTVAIASSGDSRHCSRMLVPNKSSNSLHCWTRPISNRFSEARERNTLELVQLELSESSLAK